MESVGCPHCGAINAGGDAFCRSCGKALPLPTSGPRVYTGDNLPQSQQGQALLGEDLKKQIRRVTITLLLVGILQLTCGMVLAITLSQLDEDGTGGTAIIMVVQLIIGVGFLGLSFWSRFAPLPAAITGLVIYITLVAVNVLMNVAQLASGKGGGIGIGCLDIVIIGVLAQGIQAALKHRKLSLGTTA